MLTVLICFLPGNDITKVEGIEGLHDLRELVLDRNRIKCISEMSFANQWNLQELHLEENRIRDLSNLNCMEHLQRMYLGSNRIQVGQQCSSPYLLQVMDRDFRQTDIVRAMNRPHTL